MKKIFFVFLVLVNGVFGESRFYDGDSTFKSGNMYFHDDGEMNYRNGDTLFLDNGDRIEKRGDSYYNSNGESTTKRGNTYFHDNGGMSWDLGGGNMIHSDEESQRRMEDLRDFEW